MLGKSANGSLAFFPYTCVLQHLTDKSWPLLSPRLEAKAPVDLDDIAFPIWYPNGIFSSILAP